MEQMTNPYEQDGFDLDMLTEVEITELGIAPQFNYNTKEYTCTHCGRKVKEPITSHEVAGVELLPDDKVAHKGCAQRYYDTIMEGLRQLKEEGEL